MATENAGKWNGYVANAAKMQQHGVVNETGGKWHRTPVAQHTGTNGQRAKTQHSTHNAQTLTV